MLDGERGASSNRALAREEIAEERERAAAVIAEERRLTALAVKERRTAERELRALKAEASEQLARSKAEAADHRRSSRLGSSPEKVSAAATTNLRIEQLEGELKRSMARHRPSVIAAAIDASARESVAVAALAAAQSKHRQEQAAAERSLKDALRQVDHEQVVTKAWEKKVGRLSESITDKDKTITDKDIQLGAFFSQVADLEQAVADGKKTVKRQEKTLRQMCQKVEPLEERSRALAGMRSGEARTGLMQQCHVERSSITPPAKPRLDKYAATRRKTSEADRLRKSIGEKPEPAALARTLESIGVIDKLMDTDEFWDRRVRQAQAYVDSCNKVWDVDLSARIKQDWLNSNRDLDGMRGMFSHFIPAPMEEATTEGADARPPRPRHRVLLCNPHKPWDKKQYVFFPEPIKPRCGASGWSAVIDKQNTEFGLDVNPLHPNCTQRDFSEVLQEVVTRDASLLSDPASFGPDRPLQVVIGLDGFDSYCHVLLRLIDYKEGTSVESELKGVALAVAVGDDHNPNLSLIFSAARPRAQDQRRARGEGDRAAAWPRCARLRLGLL